MRLHGWSLIGPAACPWDQTIGVLDCWPGARAIRLQPPASLCEWISLVSSALTHRGRLSADDVRWFAEPFRALVPDLERVLNEPVVGVDR